MKHVTTLALAVAVSSVAACMPSIDAAAKARVDQQLAETPPVDRDIAAPAAAEPMPLEVGQWIRLEQVDQDGHPAITTYAVVGAEADAWWLEVTTDSYYGRSGTRMLVALGDRTDPAAIDIRALITRDNNGNVNEMPRDLVGMMRSVYQPVLDTLVLRWDALPQQDAAVTAGRFAGCYHGRSTVAIAGRSTTSDVWWHPEVPINGVVKTVGVSDASSSELLDYGTTGATSMF